MAVCVRDPGEFSSCSPPLSWPSHFLERVLEFKKTNQLAATFNWQFFFTSTPLLMLFVQPRNLSSTWNPLPCLPPVQISLFFQPLHFPLSGGSGKPGHHQVNGSCQGCKSLGPSETGQASSRWALTWDIGLLSLPVSSEISLVHITSFLVSGLEGDHWTHWMTFSCWQAWRLLSSHVEGFGDTFMCK